MAKLSIDQLKQSFETGDRPNGNDFTNLIDTLAANATGLGLETNNDETITGIENETIIDSFIASEWRTVKYSVSLVNTVDLDNQHYATEISILMDNQDINISEYGSLDNNGDVGTVTVSKDNGTVNLIVAPKSITKPVTVRFIRTGLKA